MKVLESVRHLFLIGSRARYGSGDTDLGRARFSSRRQGRNSPLFGVSLCSFDPAFVDIASTHGFDIVWIEMEHANVAMREAEILCRIINSHGMLSLIRLPNGDRDVVLKAAETGADMLMLPMVNSAKDLQTFALHALYSPVGERGFHKFSRSMNFGLGNTVGELRKQANDNLLLWGQVETPAALRNLNELCQVEGIDGLFVGPGDLSAAFGVPGEMSDPRVVDAVLTSIATSQESGKLAGTAASTADAARWITQGVDMLMIGNNYGLYVTGMEALRKRVNELVQASQQK
jgi:2-keto-3-deoxy-L-rhamnonate aldolase RhmA